MYACVHIQRTRVVSAASITIRITDTTTATISLTFLQPFSPLLLLVLHLLPSISTAAPSGHYPTIALPLLPLVSLQARLQPLLHPLMLLLLLLPLSSCMQSVILP